ncbi:unnamed protein product, partial [Nesidiocoris tenuis]
MLPTRQCTQLRKSRGPHEFVSWISKRQDPPKLLTIYPVFERPFTALVPMDES